MTYDFDFIIGIDPDVERSGLAVVNRRARCLVAIGAMPFAELADWLSGKRNVNALVVVECSWDSESNWHLVQKFGSTARAAAIGRAVGLNHATGMHIAALAERYGFTVRLQRPLKKIGHGRDGKLTHADCAYYMTGFDELKARTNQEERDAARLAWVAAGLPERVKV